MRNKTPVGFPSASLSEKLCCGSHFHDYMLHQHGTWQQDWNPRWMACSFCHWTLQLLRRGTASVSCLIFPGRRSNSTRGAHTWQMFTEIEKSHKIPSVCCHRRHNITTEKLFCPINFGDPNGSKHFECFLQMTVVNNRLNVGRSSQRYITIFS